MPRATTVQQGGFTLMELLVVMTIVAIIAGFGVPSFTQFLRAGELTSRANSVIVALQLARSEAISRGQAVLACPSTDGSTCSGTNWADGWLVATDSAGTTGSVDTGAGDQILRVNNKSTQVSTKASSPTSVRFTADGLNAAGSSQTIEMQRPECGTDRARIIDISPTGRAQIKKADC